MAVSAAAAATASAAWASATAVLKAVCPPTCHRTCPREGRRWWVSTGVLRAHVRLARLELVSIDRARVRRPIWAGSVVGWMEQCVMDLRRLEGLMEALSMQEPTNPPFVWEPIMLWRARLRRGQRPEQRRRPHTPAPLLQAQLHWVAVVAWAVVQLAALAADRVLCEARQSCQHRLCARTPLMLVAPSRVVLSTAQPAG